MARVRNIPSSELPPDVAKVYEEYATSYGPFRNQCAVFAHVPPAVKHIMGLLLELKKAQTINWRYIELGIVVVSKLNECHYCVDHHKPKLKVEGVSEATIDNLPDTTGAKDLDDIDKLVVAYTIAVNNNAQRVPEKMFQQLRQHFSEAEIVELTLRITLCGFFNRFNDALQIDSELHEAAAAE